MINEKKMLLQGKEDNWSIPVTINIANPMIPTFIVLATWTLYVAKDTTWAEYLKKKGKYAICNYDSFYDTYYGTDITYLDITPQCTFVSDSSYSGFGLVYYASTDVCIQVSSQTALYSAPFTFYSDTQALALNGYTMSFSLATGSHLSNTATNLNDKIINYDEYYTANNCYLAGTLITLSNGSKVPVENFTYKDKLLVWDFDRGQLTEAAPLWISKAMSSKHYYKLTFSDGTVLKLVGSEGKCHRIFNVDVGAFVYGNHFTLGQKTFTENKTTTQLISCELVKEPCTYYNIISDYHMNIFANSILSSCGYNNMYPVQNMQFVKDNREQVSKETYKTVSDRFYYGLRLAEQDLAKRNVLKAQKYTSRLLLNENTFRN